jgi:hypothetical protein
MTLARLYCRPGDPRTWPAHCYLRSEGTPATEGLNDGSRFPVRGRSRSSEDHSEKIRTNTDQVLTDMRSKSILPRTAAVDLATRRVKQAMTYRRWSIF